MNIRVKVALVAFLASGFIGWARAEVPTESPRLLVHLLDYLAKDYGGAVSGGNVISPSEYREQVEFAREAGVMSRRLVVTQSAGDIVSGIDKLIGLVNRKASPPDVATLALQLRERVIQVSGIAQAPDRWPNLTNGRRLYLASCAPCHGERGLGDGPASVGLQPKPTNFRAGPAASDITPFRASNAIRVGIPGTPMAAWPTLSDTEVWDLAFYVSSLHVDGSPARGPALVNDLMAASTQSDRQLMASLPGTDADKRAKIAGLRLYSDEQGSTPGQGRRAEPPNTLTLARNYLAQASNTYAKQDFDGAEQAALLAYLEGIEPVEPRLRANDPAFVADLESRMSAVRSAIAARQPAQNLHSLIAIAYQYIDTADQRLNEHAEGPWFTFVLTVGILVREGFEAILILIALLAVIRASGAVRVARWVHGGWMAALAVGLLAWFFSGWAMAFSGAQREMLEGVTALVAVAVLMYVGFWLHSRTEISRWTHFIDVQVREMLHGGNLWGLAAIAFMAVFREAFETVLFPRAITLEGGAAGTRAMALGVAISLAGLLALSWFLLKFSARLPIRRIFTLSSALMVLLAIVLTGKGLHALQETGRVAVTSTPWRWSSELVGIYATWESVLAQLLIAVVVVSLWHLGNRAASPRR